jgi:predicted lipid-binding transport protein (Tim44 family)
MKFLTVLLAGVLTVGALGDAEARRLGGGGSFGRQSPNVTQRQAPPPASPTAPTNAQQRNATQQQAAPNTAAAAQPARRGFGGMFAGLAAGLGLAWLAHTLGFGEAFANILLFALLAVVAMAVIGMIMRRRAGGPNQQRYAYQGAGATAEAPVSPRQYNPAKVGNDASARPWEDPTSGFGTTPVRDTSATGVRIGAALGAGQARGALDGSQNWGVPAGFDTEGFLVAAKRNFTTLQDAWDRSDMSTLRSMMTDEMLHEIRNQLAERDRQPAAAETTEVAMLEAQLLGIEELATEYMASVEFSGLIREEPSAGPTPFREVWNMVKPKDGSAGWLVAGVQALQ